MGRSHRQKRQGKSGTKLLKPKKKMSLSKWMQLRKNEQKELQ
jgi:hypothetical protein